MGDFRAELAALVAAYDEHGGKWPQHHEEALWQAVERARAALAQPEPLAAADGEVAELVEAMRELAYDRLRVSPHTSDLLHRAADLLERQAAAAPVARLPEDAQVIEPANRTILVPVPAPIPVSERLPGPKDCDAEGRCWWGDAGDDQFVPSWRLCEQPDDTHFTHWLPAHALPLPEVNND